MRNNDWPYSRTPAGALFLLRCDRFGSWVATDQSGREIARGDASYPETVKEMQALVEEVGEILDYEGVGNGRIL